MGISHCGVYMDCTLDSTAPHSKSLRDAHEKPSTEDVDFEIKRACRLAGVRGNIISIDSPGEHAFKEWAFTARQPGTPNADYSPTCRKTRLRCVLVRDHTSLGRTRGASFGSAGGLGIGGGGSSGGGDLGGGIERR